MKKLYIAYDHESNPTAVIAANDRKSAEIAFTGMQTPMYTVEELNMDNDLGIHGVTFIMSSVEASTSDFSHRRGETKFRLWKRGL